MNRFLFPLITAALVLAVGGAAVYAFTLRTRLATTSADTQTRIVSLQELVTDLEQQLATKTEESIQLAGELRREQQKTGHFERQLADLSGTVGTLEKLAYTDSELLAKYSRVYFLNENYVPARLSIIPKEFTLQPERTYEFQSDALRFLENLLEDAADDGIDLRITSAYRSFDTQAALKAGYQVRYGTGANAFSADQGYSEHQLGTTVDFTTPALGGAFNSFGTSDAFAWLEENAWRYGFVLSYPEGNSYYQYEPWHWRFVGRDLAEDLYLDEQYFYDLDQRTIDSYLADFFE